MEVQQDVSVVVLQQDVQLQYVGVELMKRQFDVHVEHDFLASFAEEVKQIYCNKVRKLEQVVSLFESFFYCGFFLIDFKYFRLFMGFLRVKIGIFICLKNFRGAKIPQDRIVNFCRNQYGNITSVYEKMIFIYLSY